MNPTIENLKQHRSIRRFEARPIAEDHFQQLISAGQAAATSSFIQAVSLIRVKAGSARKAMVELSGGQTYIEQAPEFLVFCADLHRNAARVETHADVPADFTWAEQFLAATVDVALFAQNLVVAAESSGLGCCYIGGIRNDPDQVTQLLGLPQLVYPVFGLCLGYPGQDPQLKPRLPSEVVVHNDRYQAVAEVSKEIDQYDAHIRRYYELRSKGKLSQSWSEQMVKQSVTQSRPFILDFLRRQGFIKK